MRQEQVVLGKPEQEVWALSAGKCKSLKGLKQGRDMVDIEK
jgi:hypothetical protein